MVDLLRDAPLGFLLVQVAKSHRRWVSTALDELGLHVGQELLLAQLCRQEGVRQTALAEALGVELPTVHKTLARLEAAGFVERRPDPQDARSSLAYLTVRGRETCVQIRKIWEDADRRLCSMMSPDDAARLRDLLKQLVDRLNA